MKPPRDEPSKQQLDYYNTLRAGYDDESGMPRLDPDRYHRRYRLWRRWRIILYLVMVSLCGVGMVFAIKWIVWYKALLEQQM